MVQEKVRRKFVRVRERNQITLPGSVLEGLPIRVGDFLEVCRTADGAIQLKPSVVFAVGTPEAAKQERLADQDIAHKNYETYATAAELVSHLKDRRKKKKRHSAAAGAGAEEPVTA